MTYLEFTVHSFEVYFLRIIGRHPQSLRGPLPNHGDILVGSPAACRGLLLLQRGLEPPFGGETSQGTPQLCAPVHLRDTGESRAWYTRPPASLPSSGLAG